MKFLFFAVFVATIPLTSNAGRAVVIGNIKNTSVNSVNVSYNRSLITYEEINESFLIDKKGNFKLIFFPKKLTKFYLEIDGQQTSFFLSPGDSLTFKTDYKTFDSSIVYGGRSSAKNNLHNAVLLKFDHDKSLNSFDQISKRTPASYAFFCDSLQAEKFSFIDNSTFKPEAEFLKIYKGSIAYLSGTEKFNYLSKWRYLNRKAPKLPDLPSDYYHFMKSLTLDDTSFIGIAEYNEYLKRSVRLNVSELEARTQDKLTADDKAKLAGLIIKNKLVLGFYEAAALCEEIQHQAFSTAEESYLAYNSRNGVTNYSEELKSLYEKAKRVAPGQKATDFTLQTADGKACSLSDFKGKVVYLDFWASWCGPCLSEMPASKKIREDFSGKDVVFLYVSIDENEKSWREAIKKFEIDGVNLLAPGYSNSVSKAYNISGVPSYFLIDREGAIITNTPPRPTKGDLLTKTLNEALSK